MSRCAVARQFQKQGIRLQLKLGVGQKAPLRSPSTGRDMWMANCCSWSLDQRLQPSANGRPLFDAKLMSFYLGGLPKARLPE
jgi:hypothetical protein